MPPEGNKPSTQHSFEPLLDSKEADDQLTPQASKRFECTEIMKEKYVSKLLGVSVSTLRRWRLLGKGPIYLKLNGAVRYTAQDVQKFIDDCARVSTTRSS